MHDVRPLIKKPPHDEPIAIELHTLQQYTYADAIVGMPGVKVKVRGVVNSFSYELSFVIGIGG